MCLCMNTCANKYTVYINTFTCIFSSELKPLLKQSYLLTFVKIARCKNFSIPYCSVFLSSHVCFARLVWEGRSVTSSLPQNLWSHLGTEKSPKSSRGPGTMEVVEPRPSIHRWWNQQVPSSWKLFVYGLLRWIFLEWMSGPEIIYSKEDCNMFKICKTFQR